MRPADPRVELALALAALAALGFGILLVLLPFVSALLWAAILAFAVWPLQVRLVRLLRGHAGLAAGFATTLLALALLLPLVLVGRQIADAITLLVETVRQLLELGMPPPPEWLFDLPVLGPELVGAWNRLAEDMRDLPGFVQPWLSTARDLAIRAGLALGSGLFDLSLSLTAVFFFLRDGPSLLEQMRRAGERILGGRMQHLLEVAGSTVRGVVYGFVGTAIVQGVVAAIGFALVGLPGALVLGVLTFFTGLLPAIGPPLVWVPLSVWLVVQGQTTSGVFLAAYGVLVISGIDNLIRPWLISRESNLSFLLTFLGVFGGAIAFGFLGIFIGPVLLALGRALLEDWVRPEPEEAKPSA
ncbi:MAG: AI-2E family transporter [Geminicoccaceae bacterium]|nr:AI-2E family transporter [Geminicoccaceae bacterium]MDW8340624.1 AI-2E family transporter [Geminicoccaceae bacterium]